VTGLGLPDEPFGAPDVQTEEDSPVLVTSDVEWARKTGR
jgi:hypothetical protein